MLQANCQCRSQPKIGGGQRLGGQNVRLSASNNILILDAASQSTKSLDMLNIRRHGFLDPPRYACANYSSFSYH